MSEAYAGLPDADVHRSMTARQRARLSGYLKIKKRLKMSGKASSDKTVRMLLRKQMGRVV